MKISFIGAGRTSTSTCYLVGLLSIFTEIVLLDTDEGKAVGTAIDMEQAFALAGKGINVKGTSNYDDVKDSEVIIITASIPNFTKETNAQGIDNGGQTLRESMLAGNKEIITDIANNLKKIVPNNEKQPLIIVLTNPMDIILSTFLRVGNFNKKRTIGSGNWLDGSRFKYYFSKEFNVSPVNVEVYAVAQHGAKIVYLLSQTKIENVPLFEYMKRNNISMAKIDEIVEKSILGGQEIMKHQHGWNSTVWAPGVSLFELVDAFIKDKKKLIVASVWCNGEYGVKNFAFGCPIILGKNGVEKIVEFDLNDEDKAKYAESYKFAKELDEKNR
ncbi:MAG: hypothetical protein LBT02_00855 [Rickettsiales bacterium]|jgi:malate dehydrogenase|nr:hypothetical protein [Rickettsiales bacterium]